ncbi:MAG: tetratricopeptide repeat protein [Gaiellaceae bacterium]
MHVTGRFNGYSRISDESDRKEHVFHYCPECGSQGFYTEPTEPDLVVVSLWESVGPLCGAGEYAKAADRGRELLEAHPEHPALAYNVACAESLAGRTAEALEDLGRAIDAWDGCRSLARDDSDFDRSATRAAFQDLVGR